MWDICVLVAGVSETCFYDERQPGCTDVQVPWPFSEALDVAALPSAYQPHFASLSDTCIALFSFP